MARASTPTLLALDRFAQIIGLNPAHFNGAAGSEIMPAAGSCNDVIFQYSWQAHDRMSREEIADVIHGAEQDIADYLGYYPAPKFIAKEIHQYPRHYRVDSFDYGYNVRGDYKSIKTHYARLISPGRRAVSSIGQATTGGGSLVFSDADGDGYSETATITLPTTLTDASKCEIKVYFEGESTQDWEIRPARSIAISGGNVIITFWAWQLIDPDNWETFTTADESGGVPTLDITGSIYVDTVDVYREYADYTVSSCQFFWEPRSIATPYCTACGGTGCPACSLSVQNGCLRIRDVDMGFIVPMPAEWDDTDERWEIASWTEGYAPDQVKLWYYAGDIAERYLNGSSCEALSDQFARTIAMLAVARLARPICSCANLSKLQEDWQKDMSRSGEGEASFVLSDDDLNNPFGTRKGEVMAYRRLSAFTPKVAKVAVL